VGGRVELPSACRLWFAPSLAPAAHRTCDLILSLLVSITYPVGSAQRALEEYRQLMESSPPDSTDPLTGGSGSGGIDLLLGATLIARHRYPLLSHEEVVEQVDDLAVQVGAQLD